MNSKICELLDIEFPLVAFTHCRDVVVAVSKAGGCGVLGAVGMSPEVLEQELKWIDEHIDVYPFTLVPGAIWLILKILLLFILFALVKAIVPRYRYDQLMRLGWKVFQIGRASCRERV